MKKKIFITLASVLLICMVLPFIPGAIADATNASNKKWSDQDLEEIYNKMSTDERITQTFMQSFRSWNGTPVTELNNEIRQILKDYKFGGIIIFAENVPTTENTFNMVKDYQTTNISGGGLPMLINTDQEGGIVFRLGTGTPLPGNMGLGATFNPELGVEYGEVLGSEVTSLGINTTLAPVMDVNNNANNPVINTRSYGDDPEMVGAFGSNVIAGMSHFEAIGCAKHFPGHGDTATDSHTGLPRVDLTWEQLLQTHIKPFQIAIQNNIGMIMTAHIQYPNVTTKKITGKDGKQYDPPATLSDEIITGKLKGELGFNGVVSTDGMHMQGVTLIYDEAQAAAAALEAGCDMLCMPVASTSSASFKNDMDAVISYIKEEMTKANLTEARLKDAVMRVLRLKADYGILDYNPDDYTLEKAQATVGSADQKAIEKDIANKSVTCVKNNNDTLPLRLEENENVLFLCTHSSLQPNESTIAMAWNRAKETGNIPETAIPEFYTFEKITGVANELKAQIDSTSANKIIITSNVSNANDVSYTKGESSGISGEINDAINYAKSKGKTVVVISIRLPYDCQNFENADAILVAYNYIGNANRTVDEVLAQNITQTPEATGPSILASIESIFGNVNVNGRLPINVPQIDHTAMKYTDNIIYNRGYGISFGSIEKMDKVLINLEYTEAEYTGEEIRPRITITSPENRIFRDGIDYVVSYENNVEVGTATAKIAGTKCLLGNAQVNFDIIANSNNQNIGPTTFDTISMLMILILILTILSSTIYVLKRKFR